MGVGWLSTRVEEEEFRVRLGEGILRLEVDVGAGMSIMVVAAVVDGWDVGLGHVHGEGGRTFYRRRDASMRVVGVLACQNLGWCVEVPGRW